jgi:hypothetical protein
VVVDYSGGSPRLMVDRIGMCSLVSETSGVAKMFTMCLVSSLSASCVVFGVGCEWVFLRWSRARCLRRMALLQSVRMSLLTGFSQSMPRGY